MARPSSSVLTSPLDGRFARFMPSETTTQQVLDARLCFMVETLLPFSEPQPKGLICSVRFIFYWRGRL
jgi:hypothetical protein